MRQKSLGFLFREDAFRLGLEDSFRIAKEI